jgi:glycerophosphoryl diester phosphodiesterase
MKFILLMFVTSCTYVTMAQNIKHNFDLQGHRGCRGLMPENTIPAFLKAIDLGVTTLEMDVVITKDKQVILSHEPFFSHEITTLPNGDTLTLANEKSTNIYRLTYAETTAFDIGLLKHNRFPNQQKLAATKPLLDSVIKVVKQYCKLHKKVIPFFNIETKCTAFTDTIFHPMPKEFVDLIMQVIVKNKIQNKTIIQSFDVRTLKEVNNNYAFVKTALLIEGNDKSDFQSQLNSLGFVPSIYSPHFSLVDSNLIKLCKKNKIKIIPWTVNDLPTMKTLVTLGVDGLISDYPNLFSQIKENQ